MTGPYDDRGAPDPASDPAGGPARPLSEDDVRTLLAGLRVEEPLPDAVATRLDAALADLVAERRAGALNAAEPASGGRVVPLRRRWPQLVAAAAAVVVVGTGVQQVMQGGVDSMTSAGQAESADRAVVGEQEAPAAEDGPSDERAASRPQDAGSVSGQGGGSEEFAEEPRRNATLDAYGPELDMKLSRDTSVLEAPEGLRGYADKGLRGAFDSVTGSALPETTGGAELGVDRSARVGFTTLARATPALIAACAPDMTPQPGQPAFVGYYQGRAVLYLVATLDGGRLGQFWLCHPYPTALLRPGGPQPLRVVRLR